MIVTHDAKGDRWSLIPTTFSTSKSGLVELSMLVAVRPKGCLEAYPFIPVPVFTEWWPDVELRYPCECEDAYGNKCGVPMTEQEMDQDGMCSYCAERVR